MEIPQYFPEIEDLIRIAHEGRRKLAGAPFFLSIFVSEARPDGSSEGEIYITPAKFLENYPDMTEENRGLLTRTMQQFTLEQAIGCYYMAEHSEPTVIILRFFGGDLGPFFTPPSEPFVQ